MALVVAYLVNQYPKVSHSFIRREITALERQGVTVHRFGQRGWDASDVHDEDAQERSKTRYLVRAGMARLASALIVTTMTSPRRMVGAVRQMLMMSRASSLGLARHLVYLAEACLLREWLVQCAARHLHAHFGTNSAEIAMYTRILGGPPYSFTVHGPEEFDRPQALRLDEKVRHAAFVVAISSYGRSQLWRWMAPADWPKVKVVHCGLEPAFHADPDGTPIGEHLVCVGRLCEQKGQLLLIQALAQLHRRGRSMSLVLAGDGEMRPMIEAEVARHGLQSVVRITGWISSAAVRKEILAARALVLPSFAEGLPVVLMEAMALRRPVITTFVAGIPELVRPGRDGWLVPAGDVHALADAMAACAAADSNALLTMGDAARAQVLAHHEVDAQAAILAQAMNNAQPEVRT